MREICKKHNNAGRGRSVEFNIDEIIQTHLGAFYKDYVFQFILKFESELGYIEITQMGKAKVDLEIRRKLTDHSMGDEEWYRDVEEEEALQAYIKAIPNLTIGDEQRLQIKVEDLEQKNQEIQVLKAKVDKISNAVIGLVQGQGHYDERDLYQIVTS